MSRFAKRIEETGVVAIVRLDDYAAGVEMATAIADGGVTAIEFTYTNPRAGETIAHVKAALGDRVLVGAGTVLDPETARAAMLQGADFIVTPTLSLATIGICRRYDVSTIIGAFSPTEILTAWEAGATYVKVFPAGSVGPRYLKDVRGPLPQIKLIPTGGVDLANTADFIRTGASAIAVGSNLVDGKLVATGDWTALRERARHFVDAVRTARQ